MAWSPSPVVAVPTATEVPTAASNLVEWPKQELVQQRMVQQSPDATASKNQLATILPELPPLPKQLSMVEVTSSLIETLPGRFEPEPKGLQEVAMIEWPTVQHLGPQASAAHEIPQLITEIPDPFSKNAQSVAVNSPSAPGRLPTPDLASVQSTLPSLEGAVKPSPAPSKLEPMLIAEQGNEPSVARATPEGTVDRWIDSLGDGSSATPALLTSHSGALGSNHSIRLGQIPTVENQPSSSDPIGVLPIARLTQSDTTRNVSSTFNTARYTGPMASAEELFMNLQISEEFQTQHGEQLQAQRTSLDNDASSYTWMPGVYTWASPSFYHRPLYFEQANLERYGMGPSRCAQPLFSGMHFFSSIALMPYKLLTQHPHERVYSLGNQRPGDAACYQGRSLLGQSYVGEVCRYWDEHSGYQ